MQIEAMLASPPERDQLVVQLFVKDGGQWGEIHRDRGVFLIDLFVSDGPPIQFRVDDVIEALSRSQR
jgi:hypothetical protein